MKNNERNSRKRLNSLILLVAFTAIMLIVSTYAWFSSQKNVTLTGLHGEVNVAEGLQISLDAEHWVNTINFDHFEQTAGAWTVKSNSPTEYLSSGATFQAPATGVTNVTPDELLPLSTTGYKSTNDGVGQTALKFYDGTNTETKKLMDDTHLVTENSEAGYFAFDVFVMNTSAGSDQDVIQLDPTSDVTGDNESTGVQNTARVAFALYNNNNDAEGFTEDPTYATAGASMTIAGKNKLSVAQIIAGTSTGKTIKDIAIWEPNADKHTETIVSSLANSIKLDAAEYARWTGLGAQDGNTGVSRFSTTQLLPTYALTSASLPGTAGDGSKEHISDVYDWRIKDNASTAAKGVKKQYTLQTNAYEADASGTITYRTTSVDLVSTGKIDTYLTANATKTEEDVADTTFTLNPSQYSKIRIYFWMEGQDPDCINAASLGGGLTLNIGFSKPGSDTSADVSGS